MSRVVLKITAIIIIAGLLPSSCGLIPRGKETSKIISDDHVSVLFFHGRKRCITCNSILSIAERVVYEYSKTDQDVELHEINFTLRENLYLAERYKVAFTTIIVARGNQHTNLTEQAFGLALTNPGELESLISDEIKKYLKR